MVSHYDLLGVAPTATTAEIRAAFRRAASEFHPDHREFDEAGLGDDGTEQMVALNEAWRTLRDERRRSVYDARLSAPDGEFDPAPADSPDIRDADSGSPMRRGHLELLILTMALGTIVLVVLFVIAMSQSGC